MPIACFIFGLWIVAAILSSRCLYADGSHEFVRVLEAQNFVAFMWSRHFAFYIYEFPLVLAIKLGITNLSLLRFAFGLGCFLPWPLAMFCCWRISPKNFWLAVVGCAAGYLNVAIMAVGEHILAHALFWPALFVILFARQLNFFAGVVLLTAATGILYSYESEAVLCMPLALLCLWRAWQDRKQFRDLTWVVFLTASALYFAGVTIGLCGILLPELPENLRGFKSGTVEILWHIGWTFGWTLVWGGVTLAAFFSKKITQIISKKVTVYFLLVSFLVWGLWPFLLPGKFDNAVQYDNRVLDLLVPLALLPVALIARFRPQWIETKQRLLVQMAAALLAAQSLWQISATVRWYQDVIGMRRILSAESGIIPLRMTDLMKEGMQGHELEAGHIGGRFDWTWPCLSIAIASNTKINSLICSEFFIDPVLQHRDRESFEPWQPFDPFKPDTLPKLGHYGISYDGYIATLHKQLSTR